MGRSQWHQLPNHPILSLLWFRRSFWIGSWRRKTEALLSSCSPHRLHLFRHWGGVGFGGSHSRRPPFFHSHPQGYSNWPFPWRQIWGLFSVGDHFGDLPSGRDQYGSSVGTPPHKRVDSSLHQLWRDIAGRQLCWGGNTSSPFDPCGTKMKCVIAGGGTGGHLFPGVAIAEAFVEREKGNEVLFMGREKGLEPKVISGGKFTLRTIKAKPIKGKSLLEKVKAIWSLPIAISEASSILKEFRPQLVL